MRRFLLTILSFTLAFSLGAGGVLAEDSPDAAPIPLPEPQDLATLFPDDAILTKDFGDFTISYPGSMTFEETAAENDADQTVALTDKDGHTIAEIRWTDLSSLADEDSMPAYDRYVMLALMYITYYQVGLAADAKERGWDCEYSADPAMVSFSGRSAATVLMHTKLVSPDESTVQDGLYLFAPLGDTAVLTFAFEWGTDLSERVVQSSILNTVKWKE